MFEHLDDTAAVTAPPVAQVRHRARQIVADRRRNRLAAGTAALAATSVAGIAVVAPLTRGGAGSSSSGVAAAGTAEAPVEAPAAEKSAYAGPVDDPNRKKGAGAQDVEPAPERGKKTPDGSEPPGLKEVPASPELTAACLAAYDKSAPTYVPAGLALSPPMKKPAPGVPVPARDYSNSGGTQSFSVIVTCAEAGATPGRVGSRADDADLVAEPVQVGGRAALLHRSHAGVFASVSWQLDERVMVEVLSKGSLDHGLTRVSDAELLKIAASVPAT